MRTFGLVLLVLLTACSGKSGAPVPAAAKAERVPICEAAKSALPALDKPVRVEAHVGPGAAARVGLERLLAEYKRQSNGRLDWAVLEDHGPADIALVIAYGSESQKVEPVAADGGGTEFFILSTLASLRARANGTRHSIGVVVGHGEPRFTDKNLVPKLAANASLAGIVEQYFPEYRLVDVDLRNGEKAVDPSLDGLFVLQPSRDWSDPELARIDAAVLAGQTVVFVASAVNVEPRNTHFPGTLNVHRLDKLLSGYGIDLHRDALFDFDSDGQFSVPVPTHDGTTLRMRFPAFPAARTAAETDVVHPIFFRIPRVVFPYASSLELNEKVQPEARYFVLARSSPRTSAETAQTQSFDPMQQYHPKRRFGEHVVAVAVEGTLKSAFGDAKSQKRGAVAVLATASLFANPAVVEGSTSEALDSIAAAYAEKNVQSQILVLENTLDWMAPFDRALATCAETKLPR